MAKTNKELAYEVMMGQWGNGADRKARLEKAGYNYEGVQSKVTELVTNRAKTVKAMNAWATKIVNDNSYHYKLWKSGDVKTHRCPICENYPAGTYRGWNCIGFAFAVWHHGGGIPCNCNCGVVANETGEAIANAKTDAEALKIARKNVGINNIMVIRNDGKDIPKSKWEPGDICLKFNGKKYLHTFYYRGDKKVTDSTGSSGKIANDKQIATRNYDNYSARVIIRYLGEFNKELKSTEEIAQEVLAGKWGNGEERKQRLTAAGYDYNTIQKRVTELVTQKKPYQNLNPSDYISTAVYIGQATCDENGKMSDGMAGDQKGGEVGISQWSYSSKENYNHWTQLYRFKDTAKQLIVAQAMIDTCNNNHIGYDTQTPDRYSAYDEAAKVNWHINKIIKNCETTCSEAVSMCLRAADVPTAYAPRLATVDILKSKIKESNLFYTYTDEAHMANNNRLLVGDILFSATHVAVVVKAPPVKKVYSGTLPTLTLKKSNAQVIADTIKWAKIIANDNDFHYGYTSKDKSINAHHNGCYFCGTNTTKGGRSKKGIVGYEKTYCCNPFVGAAWAHGGCVPTALKLCQSGSSWGFSKNSGYNKSKLFTNLGHPSKSSLKPGDVLCRDTHVALYIGDGKIVQASGGDDNKRNSARWNKSISVSTLTDSNYKNFPRVHRFNSSVNASVNIKHGELSDRVALWQTFLNWWFGKSVVKVDRYFGDTTLKWTKQFQLNVLGKGKDNGVIDSKTLEAAKKCKR